MDFLVETALLTHGLKSIKNETILSLWKDFQKNIVFIDKGKLVIGDIKSYLDFRHNTDKIVRVDMNSLDLALNENLSAALTASATMRVCKEKGIKLAVTCGMGGVGNIKGEELCPDLPALRDLGVKLISTGPKDMLDRKSTIDWLKSNGVNVIGRKRNYTSGYIFSSEHIEIRDFKEYKKDLGKCLIISEIDEEERIKDLNILDIAVKEGYKKQKEGFNFHPAVNEKIDEFTQGKSSLIQLKSLIDNIELAKIIIKHL